MEQYIPKAAVMTEIEELINSLRKNCNPNPFGSIQECLTDAQIEALSIVKESIEDINAKKVDLEKEVSKWIEENCDDAGYFNQLEFAKHFFEIGVEVQKGE